MVLSEFVGKKGALVLEDGTRFEGDLFGADRCSAGEVVFNTGMVGYPGVFLPLVSLNAGSRRTAGFRNFPLSAFVYKQLRMALN